MTTREQGQTPETDYAAFDIDCQTDEIDYSPSGYYVRADFARRLERQRDELVRALEAAVASVKEPTGIGIGIAGMEFRWPEWVTQARAALASVKGE